MIKKTVTLKNRVINYENQVISNIKPDLIRFSTTFKNPVEFVKKEKHIEFITYLNDMIDFDLLNGLDLVSDDNSVKWFNFAEKQNDLIYYYDLISIGGRITANAFDIKQYTGINGGTDAAVKTASITAYILEELSKIKTHIDNGELHLIKPYGVNCVLVSMIEHEIKLHASRKYISNVLKQAKIDKDSGSLHFNCTDDEEYFDELYSEIIEDVEVLNGGNDIWMTGCRFKKFLNDYPQYSLNYGIESAMFDRTLTLNNLIQNAQATADWEPEFLKIMKSTFGTGKLNLRNNLAHCGYTEYNYHSVFTSFYLNEIFLMIVKDFYLK